MAFIPQRSWPAPIPEEEELAGPDGWSVAGSAAPTTSSSGLPLPLPAGFQLPPPAPQGSASSSVVDLWIYNYAYPGRWISVRAMPVHCNSYYADEHGGGAGPDDEWQSLWDLRSEAETHAESAHEEQGGDEQDGESAGFVFFENEGTRWMKARIQKRMNAVEGIQRKPEYILTQLYNATPPVIPDYTDMKITKRAWEKAVKDWRAELRAFFEHRQMNIERLWPLKD